jgi:acetoin utilization deacetylase AcuC-like enzyme
VKPIVYSGPVFGLHQTPVQHPEHAGRWTRLHEGLERHAGIILKAPVGTGLEAVGEVHDATYLSGLAALCGAGGGSLDPDTSVGAHSLEVALAASGSALDALAGVIAGTPAFIAARPPGHHAGRDRAMGFCLINHVAVAARAAVDGGARRVAIVDWDVHHGNGTQNLVQAWPEVSFLSLHQDGHWPGTGPTGDLEGGRIRNLGIPARTGHEAYLEVVRRLVLPWLTRQAPEIVLVSAGYDAHHEDPLGRLSLEARTYHQFAAMLASWCRDRTGGVPLLAVLEGGYAPEAMVRSVLATLDGLELGESGSMPDVEEPRFTLSHDSFTALTRSWRTAFPEPWISSAGSGSGGQGPSDVSDPAPEPPSLLPRATPSG